MHGQIASSIMHVKINNMRGSEFLSMQQTLAVAVRVANVTYCIIFMMPDWKRHPCRVFRGKQ